MPGAYTVSIKVDGREYTQKLEVLSDPNATATVDEIRKQVALALQIREKVTELTEMGNSIEWIRKQIDDSQAFMAANGTAAEIVEASEALDDKFIELEQNLFILRTTGASENLLRFPQQLFSHFKMLGNYVMKGEGPPTKSKYEVFEELSQRLDGYQRSYASLVENDLKTFNELLRRNGVFAVNAVSGNEKQE